MGSLEEHVLHESRQVDREFVKFVLNEYNYGYHSVMGKVEGHMNYSTAVFLINDQVRAIYAIYENEKQGERVRRYLFKTFNKDVKVGDYIVVPSTIRLLFDIALVTDVDVDIDIDSATNVDWVVSVIDISDFYKLIEEEKNAITTIKQAQMSERRDKLAASLSNHKEKLKALPLSRRAKEDANS